MSLCFLCLLATFSVTSFLCIGTTCTASCSFRCTSCTVTMMLSLPCRGGPSFSHCVSVLSVPLRQSAGSVNLFCPPLLSAFLRVCLSDSCCTLLIWSLWTTTTVVSFTVLPGTKCHVMFKCVVCTSETMCRLDKCFLQKKRAPKYSLLNHTNYKKLGNQSRIRE